MGKPIIEDVCECFFGITDITSHSECTEFPCRTGLLEEDDVVAGGGSDEFRLVKGCMVTQMFDFEKCLSIRCTDFHGECECKKNEDNQKWYFEKIIPVSLVIAEFKRELPTTKR